MGKITAIDISIEGIVSSVPKNIADNLDDKNIEAIKAQKILETTGIRYRRISDKDTTTSDLCLNAAQQLIREKNIETSDIEVLIFLSQTPDYILPATATILQGKLGLPVSSIAFDVNLGCSGYVYGLQIISSLLEKTANPKAKALLLVGDTSSKLTNPKDLSTYPLFGDCGTATLLGKEKNKTITFDLFTDGKGWEAIKVDHGGFRNPIDSSSNELISIDGVNYRRERDLYLNGMDVFSFGISRVPKAIKAYFEENNIDKDLVDYFLFHQANMMMNEKIRKKLKLSEKQVPYSLYDYANTSSATIPLTLTTQVGSLDIKKEFLTCGFGVGLSWGIAHFHLDQNTYIKHLEYSKND
jgi:3-oxoacyl-[acyl-carrier-protein] synthase-3